MHDTLIDPATLARHLGEPGWVVLDLRHDLADRAGSRRCVVALLAFSPKPVKTPPAGAQRLADGMAPVE